MSRYSDLLERHRLQTSSIPPDLCMHDLTANQGVNEPTKVVYRRKGGQSGFLGSGSFGLIQLEYQFSECEDAPRLRAVKTIEKRTADASRIQWRQEVENLLVLSQYPDFFVTIYGWWEDKTHIHLPMEYFEASDLSRNEEFIRHELDIQSIAQQIAHGLEKMHGLKIIHRDIKPHNIFVVRQRPDWHVKIGDFGFSKRISDSVSAPFSARGTMKYMAPEYRYLLNTQEDSDFTTAVDMWSFGCLIYELFARRCPFGDDSSTLMAYMRNGIFPRQPLDDCGASKESISLVERLLEREPHLRCSAHDALQSPWLSTTGSGRIFTENEDIDERDEVSGLEDEAMPTKEVGESTRHRAFGSKSDAEGAFIEQETDATSSSSRSSFTEVMTLSKAAVDSQAGFPSATRPSALPESRGFPLTGITSSALGGMGGLSAAQDAMLANCPPEMKPFMEAERKRQRDQETLSKPAVDSQAVFPSATRPSAQPHHRGLSGFLWSALGEMREFSANSDPLLVNCPDMMKPFLEAEIKRQRDLEIERLVSDLDNQVMAMINAIADAPPERKKQKALELRKALEDGIAAGFPPEIKLFLETQLKSLQ